MGIERLRAERARITTRLAAGDPDADQLRARLAVVEADITRHETSPVNPFARLPQVADDDLFGGAA